MIINLRPSSKYKTENVRTIAICTRHSMRLKMRLSGPSSSRDVRPNNYEKKCETNYEDH